MNSLLSALILISSANLIIMILILHRLNNPVRPKVSYKDISAKKLLEKIGNL